MAELSLDQIKTKLAFHADEYGEREHTAIDQLIGAFGVSDFLDRVRTETDTLFRNDSLMRYMADLLQKGFDAKRLADFDLYVNPIGFPPNGTGSEIFVLFPDPTNRFINHPSFSVGHYYGQGQVCGNQGEVWLHGAMKADMRGEAQLHLFGQCQADCGGSASVELFDLSLAHLTDEVSARLHDFSMAEALSGASACRIAADGYSHLILKSGKHQVELSGDVLFMDMTESTMRISDRCSGYKSAGELSLDQSAFGMVWRDRQPLWSGPIVDKIYSRRKAGAELRKPRLYSPERINQAKHLLAGLGKQAKFQRRVEEADTLTELAGLLASHLDELLAQGLQMSDVKRLFTPEELRGVQIYTGLDGVPTDLKSKYHVFDHLIVSQTNDKAHGIFHDSSMGIVKAGQAEGVGLALIQGEGNSIGHASEHSTMVLLDQAKGEAVERSVSLIGDHAQLTAKDDTIVTAAGHAVLNAKGHSMTYLHEDAVGTFSESAAFVATGHSRYSMADDARGVAVRQADGSYPISLNPDRQAAKVDRQGERAFWHEQSVKQTRRLLRDDWSVGPTQKQKNHGRGF